MKHGIYAILKIAIALKWNRIRSSFYFLKLLIFSFFFFFFFRAHSNLNLRATFIWLSTINKCYMMGNLQVALLLLIMPRLLMLSYALNPHRKKILRFLYTPHMLLCFRFVSFISFLIIKIVLIEPVPIHKP